MKQIQRKPVKWVGSAKKDLDKMPGDVQDVFGHAIDLAQAGGKHPDAKPFRGQGSGVLEVVEDYSGDTYRAVYTVRFVGWVYVVHCFQKKSVQGIKTPQPDLDLIDRRMKAATADYEAWVKAQKGARK